MTEGGVTLAVTSSTGVMGLAVGVVPADTGSPVELLAEIDVVTDRRHAEEISPRLAELLGRADLGFADLDRLVIDVGPGRFTGLRVGLATVRALAFALSLPVVGITSLEVLAAGARPDRAEPGPVTAVIDARREEVFQQTFVDGRPVEKPRVGSPEQLVQQARGLVVGDGLDRYLDVYDENGIEPVQGVTLRAAVMLELSRGRPGLPGTQVRPLYLREPDAKPNIKTRVGAAEAGARS